MRLQGSRALVTGGSRGLGKAIAARFLAEGADVAICGRDEEALEAALEELRGFLPRTGQRVVSHVCDVSRPKEVSRLFEQVVEAVGPLDVVVANAGVYGPFGPVEATSFDEWVKAVETNLYGVLLPTQAVIPLLKEQGHGKIIALSGGGATRPLPNLSAYAASKAAVVRLVETLAEELKPWRIDVNAIAPGPLNTRMLDQVLEAGPEAVGEAFYEQALAQRHAGGVPLHRGAALAVYLASRESDGITGRLLSAQWDPWESLHTYRDELARSDVYCLRRIVPADRGFDWGAGG